MSTSLTSRNISIYGLVLWFLTSMFYNFQFFARSLPNTLGKPIMATFGMSQSKMGYYTSIYFLAYGLVQIPLGMALDHWGPKRVLRLSTSLCVVGLGLSFIASNYALALFGRCLTGVGMACSFTGSVRLSALWIAPTYLAFSTGMTAALGKIGGAEANALVPRWLEWMGNWQTVVGQMTIIMAVISALMWILAKDGPQDTFNTKKELFSLELFGKNALRLISNPTVLAMAFYGYTLTLSLTGFSDTHSIPFLAKKYNVSVKEAGLIASFVSIGSALGSCVLTYISDLFKRRKLLLQISALGTVITSGILFFGPSMSPHMAQALLLFFGFFSGGQVLSFIVTTDVISHRLMGLGVGLINTFIMCGGALHNLLIGKLLEASKTVDANGLVEASYHNPVLSLFIAFCMALFISLIVPESHAHRRPANLALED